MMMQQQQPGMVQMQPMQPGQPMSTPNQPNQIAPMQLQPMQPGMVAVGQPVDANGQTVGQLQPVAAPEAK